MRMSEDYKMDRIRMVKRRKREGENKIPRVSRHQRAKETRI